ncbi:TniB family NTP-binding protein [Paenibacillus sp. B01]|uniref:TniB family NTP-binding protein n=1 Tax=Paenibacillus sp. B01 TaxID=2660554 RepID=UPI001891A93D|nr:TniB family NTP-binding protein [Paenibacillus sp. B01]
MDRSEFTDFQDRVINLYIEHPEVKRIWSLLDSRRMFRRRGIQNQNAPMHLFLMGKSRVGKTQAVKRYTKKQDRGFYIDEEGSKVDIIPVVYAELPDKFTPKELYNNIIHGIGAVKLYGRVEVGLIKDRAFSLLQKHRTEMLIIDELDYLIPHNLLTRKQAMELIKGVANQAGVCLVCVGTPEIEALRTLNEQHIGRYAPNTIPRFEKCDEYFINLLDDIEQNLGLKKRIGLSDVNKKYPQILHKLSMGFVGWLVPILQNAFEIIGVFDQDFNDFNILKKLDGNVLIQARRNVVGDITKEDIKKILKQ